MRPYDRSNATAVRSPDNALASLARDLRDPLHPLQCSIDLIRHYQDRPLPAEVRELAQRQVDRLCQLIDRLDAPRPAVDTEPVALLVPPSANENRSACDDAQRRLTPPAFAR